MKPAAIRVLRAMIADAAQNDRDALNTPKAQKERDDYFAKAADNFRAAVLANPTKYLNVEARLDYCEKHLVAEIGWKDEIKNLRDAYEKANPPPIVTQEHVEFPSLGERFSVRVPSSSLAKYQKLSDKLNAAVLGDAKNLADIIRKALGL